MTTPVPDFFLLGTVRVPGHNFRPGEAIVLTQHSKALQAAIKASGVAWPASDVTVAAASALCASLASTKAAPDEDLQAIMLAAASASAKASGMQELTATVGFAQLAGLGTATTFDVLLGGLLPTGARLAALAVAEGWTGFDDPTHAVVDVTVGTALGGAQVGASTAVDVTTGAGFPKALGAGGFVGLSLSGSQVSLRVSSTVHLATMTAGAVTVKVFYTVQP